MQRVENRRETAIAALTTSQAHLVLVAGPSGVGKDTLTNWLVSYAPRVGVSAKKWIGYVTRSPRQHEVHEVDYHFVPRETFEALMADGTLVEHNEYGGNWYGKGLNHLASHMQDHNIVVGCIDSNGLHNYRALEADLGLLGRVTYVFVDAPDDVFYKRMAQRGQADEEIDARLVLVAEDRQRALAFEEQGHPLLRVMNGDGRAGFDSLIEHLGIPKETVKLVDVTGQLNCA